MVYSRQIETNDGPVTLKTSEMLAGRRLAEANSSVHSIEMTWSEPVKEI
jgi:hypothetical protein